ncbi:MAG: YbaY family lipoprotein [Anaerolineae bacterium]
MKTLITGNIYLPNDAPEFENATIYIWLEAVGMMDMPAQVVVESVLSNVQYQGVALPFTVAGSLDEHEGAYNVRAHVSMHGEDDVRRGDYVSKRAYPVLQDRHPDTVDIRVERV